MSASLRFLANVLNLAAESIKKEFLFHLYPFFVGAQLTSPGTEILALSQAHFSRWLSAPGVQPAEEPGREKPASVVHSLQGSLWWGRRPCELRGPLPISAGLEKEFLCPSLVWALHTVSPQSHRTNPGGRGQSPYF